MKSKAEENAKHLYDFILTQLARIDHLESFIFRCGEKDSNIGFLDAIRHCQDGIKMIRRGWKGTNFAEAYMYYITKHNRVGIYLDHVMQEIYPNHEDMLANDWEEVKENKFCKDWSL